MSSNQEISLDCGAGIIDVFRAKALSWEVMLSEWIDNAFGAQARNITIRKTGSRMEIIDDGQGCDDLRIMQSPARGLRSATNKAGMYGVGGLMSQICACQGTLSEVNSTTPHKVSRIVCEWQQCIDQDRFFAFYTEKPIPSKSTQTGLHITIHNCKRIASVDRLARDLSYRFAKHLQTDHTLMLEIDGQKIKVDPFAHPKLKSKRKLDLVVDGHRIHGFCGIVPPGEPNPYPGWSVHWGYRFLGQFHEPAEGRPSNRIYGEVYLPPEWKNIGVTKDYFSEEPTALWASLAEACRDLVDKAEAQSQNIELTSIAKAAETLLSAVISGKQSVKGARPGTTGKRGTVESTGTGGEHRNFRTTQPGDKNTEEIVRTVRTPDRVRIVFDETIDGLYRFDSSGSHGRSFLLTLNDGHPCIKAVRGDAHSLAKLCLSWVAHEIIDRSAVGDMFPTIRDMTYRDLLLDFFNRLADQPGAVIGNRRRRRPAMAS
ncbi:hypothetical protein [Singulisphaera sp. PoT]|uniref:hypothetical protein n=1 Tax=Singulisphaera sp. PoT TaxID=3411797 RepID=UPI003BF57726